ncbi:MAG: hypothetical protein JJT96_09735 [Opitutales bacterium]|nr:hypothetical protein [Opitutales bacterium]
MFLSAPFSPGVAPDPSHRDDFVMNFIGGGEFRQYIMDHVTGPDVWSQTMVTFGTSLNLMHELMSDVARHAETTLPLDQRPPHIDGRMDSAAWMQWIVGLALKGHFKAEVGLGGG